MSFCFPGNEYTIQHAREPKLCVLMWVDQSRRQSMPMYPVEIMCPAQSWKHCDLKEASLSLPFSSFNGAITTPRDRKEGNVESRNSDCSLLAMCAKDWRGPWHQLPPSQPSILKTRVCSPQERKMSLINYCKSVILKTNTATGHLVPLSIY